MAKKFLVTVNESRDAVKVEEIHTGERLFKFLLWILALIAFCYFLVVPVLRILSGPHYPLPK
jgi:hypothetical protein